MEAKKYSFNSQKSIKSNHYSEILSYSGLNGQLKEGEGGGGEVNQQH